MTLNFCLFPILGLVDSPEHGICFVVSGVGGGVLNKNQKNPHPLNPHVC